MDILVYGCLSVDFYLPDRERVDIFVYGCLSVDFYLPARERMDIFGVCKLNCRF